MTTALVIGASGGIGSACVDELSSKGYQVRQMTSADLDLNYPERIFDVDLTDVDVLVNCTGHTQGTYLGFLKNDWQNQVSQMTVNYISNLMLLKHYANSRSSGKYVWVSSASMDNHRTFHSVYISSKVGSKFAIDLVRNEAMHISILEAKVGLTKTNTRFRNFMGTKTLEEVESTYEGPCLLPEVVSHRIVQAIEQNLETVDILNEF